MSLEINKNKNDSSLELFLKGKLTNSTAPDLFDVIEKETDDVTNLVFDFKELDYISSAGIRVLLESAKRMDGKGKMLIRHCNDDIMEIFTITNLTEIFNIEN